MNPSTKLLLKGYQAADFIVINATTNPEDTFPKIDELRDIIKGTKKISANDLVGHDDILSLQKTSEGQQAMTILGGLREIQEMGSFFLNQLESRMRGEYGADVDDVHRTVSDIASVAEQINTVMRSTHELTKVMEVEEPNFAP